MVQKRRTGLYLKRTSHRMVWFLFQLIWFREIFSDPLQVVHLEGIEDWDPYPQRKESSLWIICTSATKYFLFGIFFQGIFVFFSCFMMHELYCRRRKNTSIVLKPLVTNPKNAGTYRKNTLNVVWKSKILDFLYHLLYNKSSFAFLFKIHKLFVCENLGCLL